MKPFSKFGEPLNYIQVGSFLKVRLPSVCSNFVYIAQYEDIVSILSREQPDVVIYEFVERSLQTGPEILSPYHGKVEKSFCK